MSKETVLKKEFQKKDVERLRNLMQGKYGEKTRSSVGFTNPQEFYDEGDVWNLMVELGLLKMVSNKILLN